MSEKRKQQNPNKIMNTIKTLEYIRAYPRENVATISYATKIAMPTLYRAINTLLEKEIIVQDGQDTSFAGRRANLYSINSNYAYVLGIILDKRNVSAFVTGLDGSIQHKTSLALGPDLSKDQIVSRIDKTINTVIKQRFGNTAGMDNISKIGILAASSIDVEKGTIEIFGGRECLNGFEIVAYIEKKYRKRVSLMKTSEAEAMSYVGAIGARAESQYLYLHLGQGIGACLVLGGNVYSGAHGKAGEIKKAFSPSYLSAREDRNIPYTFLDICDAIKNYIDGNPKSVLAMTAKQNKLRFKSDHELLMASLNEALEKGDSDALQLIEPTIEHWTLMISVLFQCYDPGVCVIGGDYTSHIKSIYDLLKKSVKKRNNIELIFANSGMTGDFALSQVIINDVFSEIENAIIAE